MLEFNSVTYTDKNLPLAITVESLPVEEKADGTLVVDDKNILVKVKLASLNPLDAFLKSSAIPYLFRGKKGYAYDYSGDVVAIGASAASKTGLALGDAVCGLNYLIFGKGTLSEYTLVDPFVLSGETIQKKLNSLTYEEAASYPLVFGTAQVMFDYCKLSTFKKVLIIGAGTSVGRYCVQLAKQVYNSEHIVVTCSGASEELMRELGATEVIDYKKQKSILNSVLESVKTSGQFDAIFDCCGNGDLLGYINGILRSKEEGGAYVTIVGDFKPVFSDSFFSLFFRNYGSAILRNISGKLGLLLYDYTRIMITPSEKWASKLITYFEEKHFKIFIDSVYTFDNFQEAVDRISSNQARGKVVVNIH